MTRSRIKEKDLYPLDPEVARTYKRRYRLQQQRKKQGKSSHTVSYSNSDTASSHSESESIEDMAAQIPWFVWRRPSQASNGVSRSLFYYEASWCA